MTMLGSEGPWIEIYTGPKYHVTRVVHLGKALYSHLLHSTQVNQMGTALGWGSNMFMV